MIQKIKKQVDLPLLVGKTYKTKFATGEDFTITSIDVNKNGKTTRIMGIYSNHPDLGPCPLNEDRIIPEKTFNGEVMELCSNCGDTIYCD